MGAKFSILVVCLNPGEKLKKTLESIKKQTFRDYEIIVKDGLSTDGTWEYLCEAAKEIPELCPVQEKDTGIYDAMNQAVRKATGSYLYFLNCGDYFYDGQVLERVAALIEGYPSEHGIYYGNIFERVTGQVVASNPKIDAFGCYRNVPCHQACFYERELLLLHPFDTKYRVRADYEQFLWCFFTGKDKGKTAFVYGDVLIADYEGGGFSESDKNKKLSEKEHQEIVRKYMPPAQVWKYRMLMWLTLAPLRTWIARNPVTAGIYNKGKKLWYERGRVTK